MIAVVGYDNRIVVQALAQMAEKQLRVHPVAAVVVPPFFFIGGFVVGNLFADAGIGRRGFQCFYGFQESRHSHSRVSLDGMTGRVVRAEHLGVYVEVNQAFWRIDAIAAGGDFRESRTDRQQTIYLGEGIGRCRHGIVTHTHSGMQRMVAREGAKPLKGR